MRQTLTLHLGDFAKETLRQSMERQSVRMETVVSRAALYYLSQREGDRLSARVPRFAGEDGDNDGATRVTVELESMHWAELGRAAEDEQVTVERLLQHAVMLYAADLDQGRIAADEPGA